jgi:hypothetical protein
MFHTHTFTQVLSHTRKVTQRYRYADTHSHIHMYTLILMLQGCDVVGVEGVARAVDEFGHTLTHINTHTHTHKHTHTHTQ